MFAKLVNQELEIAPTNYQDYFNFDKDEILMRRFGFKPLIEAQKDNHKLYQISYEETDDSIIEVIKDVTQLIQKKQRIRDIQNKIRELKIMRIDYINESINLATIDSVIRGLAEEQVKLQEEVEE